MKKCEKCGTSWDAPVEDCPRCGPRTGDRDRLWNLLCDIVAADDVNSGAEPSISVLYRSIDEARQYLRSGAPEPLDQQTETLRYLREQHAALMKRVEHYTSAGNGAPGFVEQIQRDLRAIEATMRGILAPLSETKPNKHAVTHKMYEAGLRYLKGRGTTWDVTDLYLAMEDERVKGETE